MCTRRVGSLWAEHTRSCAKIGSPRESLRELLRFPYDELARALGRCTTDQPRRNRGAVPTPQRVSTEDAAAVYDVYPTGGLRREEPLDSRFSRSFGDRAGIVAARHRGDARLHPEDLREDV